MTPLNWLVLIGLVVLGLAKPWWSPSPNAPVPANSMSYALLFIKPHALQMEAFVDAYLEGSPLMVLRKSTVSGSAVDGHYSAISSCAATPPTVLSTEAEEEFGEMYGTPYSDAISEGILMGADAALEKLEWSVDQLDAAVVKSGGRNRMKLESGCYSLEVMTPQGRAILVNPFYPKMREEYVAPGAMVILYEVGWDTDALSWDAFRRHIIGATNPAQASGRSIRGELYSKYAEVGFTVPPSPSTNQVHGSASPLEALKERCLWAGIPVEEDPYGAELTKALRWVVPSPAHKWIESPLFSTPIVGGSLQLFDLVENTNPTDCTAAIVQVAPLIDAKK